MNTTAKPPSARQMRFLRSLAAQRGETFAYPRTVAEASAEIERLKARAPSSRHERRAERLQVSHEMAARGDAAAVRESEIVGYGSSARWKASPR